MKIVSVDVYVVKIPPSGPVDRSNRSFITESYFINEGRRSCVYSTNMETVFVKLTSDEGIVGWGEILAPTHPEVVASILKYHLAPLVLGENPMNNQVLWDRMLDTLRERGYTGGYLVDAMAGLDIAFWDMKGKMLGLPVYMLLGGKYRDKLRCYCSSVPGAGAAEKLEHIDRLMGQGFNAFKIHSFGQGAPADLKVLQAVRGKYGADEVDLMYDAHGKLTHTEAYTLGRALGELDAIFFETPITFEDLSGHRKLAEAVDVAIAVGEPLRTIYTFQEWISSGAAEIVQPDIGRNGITEMMRIAHLAEAHHVKFGPHLSVHQAIGHAASIHISAAISNFLIYEYQPNGLKTSELYSTASYKFENGECIVPDDPGLGVEIDEPSLMKFVTEQFTVK
ncbi:mandelate racemase/muconate lactonizing enzyme family protein [Paenibacillus sp. GXUN7292]|uniref:mandelate racemase/muconate lactonizing enzyme family protein n=1 Tax=Paenibacillus sp. GXUN7292 TaxID=3422499 RepID=UPI003D7DD813